MTPRALVRNLIGISTLSLALLPVPAFAHCDGLDGPVAKAARQALDSGNPNLVLIWVQKKDEAEIRNVFQRTLEVRKLNASAREMADHYFLETLVRVHRAGEGAPYTGLKAAGRDLGPAIAAGDKAVETGSVDPVLKVLTEAVQKSVRERFKEVAAKKNFGKDNVAAGQQYVNAYVEYIHLVERIQDAAKVAPHAHQQPEARPAEHHH